MVQGRGWQFNVRYFISMITCHTFTPLFDVTQNHYSRINLTKEDCAECFCWSALLKLSLTSITALFLIPCFRKQAYIYSWIASLQTNEVVKWIYLHVKWIGWRPYHVPILDAKRITRSSEFTITEASSKLSVKF